MDRRDNPEATDGHSDEQFQKAYEVISLSYKGDEPERLYHEAISCFDSLIDIAHGNETIKEFAQRRSIDMKYLVDGASFVISKMHFNPENNYYITLGLPQNATPEELSRRWKKFMLLYHPDKQVGNEEWVSERAKKVNEAYTALKDDTKRAEYNHKLTEQALNRRFPSSPAHGSTQHRRPPKTFRRHMNGASSSGWSSIRPYMTKILMGLYILIAAIVFGFIYAQNRSSSLEAELVAEPVKTGDSENKQARVITTPATAPIEQNIPKVIPAAPVEPKKEPAPASRTAGRSTAASSTLQTIQDWFKPKETRQPRDRSSSEADRLAGALPDRNQNTARQNSALPPPSPPGPAQTEQARKEDPPQQRAEAQKSPAEQQIIRPEPARPVQEAKQQTAAQLVLERLRRNGPAQQQPARSEPVKPLQEAKQQAAVQPKTEQITKEEVEDFMRTYIRAYTKSDLETFLSLFSRSAVENNSLNFNEIRNAYKEIFREKINHYKVIDMEIMTDGQTATVSGIYNLNRYFAEQDRWIRYSGKIVWKLIRENNQLRIISANYDK